MSSKNLAFGPRKSFIGSRQFTSLLEIDDFGKKARSPEEGERLTYIKAVPSFIRQAGTSTFMPLCSHSGSNKNSPVRLPRSRSHFHV